MIVLKWYIEFYYEINIKKIIKKNNEFYIVGKHNNYIFRRVDISKINYNLLFLTQKIKKFHTILKNKEGSITTKIENNMYVLMQINLIENKKITFEDVIAVLNYFNHKNSIKLEIIRNNWIKKVDMFEKYIVTRNDLNCREYYDYFIGLSENAIKYCMYVNSSPFSLGITYKRIEKNWKLFDLYNPLNVTEGLVVFSIAEYFKNVETDDKNIDSLIEKTIFLLNLSRNDFVILISRMMFPTYFYDLFLDNKNINNFYDLYRKSIYVENCIKRIYTIAQKKHDYMPQINWITER